MSTLRLARRVIEGLNNSYNRIGFMRRSKVKDLLDENLRLKAQNAYLSQSLEELRVKHSMLTQPIFDELFEKYTACGKAQDKANPEVGPDHTSKT